MHYPVQARAQGGPQAHYFNNDTIVALATALGGPLSIIRMSGLGAKKALIQIARLGSGEIIPRQLQLARFFDQSGQVIDEGMWVFFAGPASYTGEDVVELHVHGNPLIVEKIIQALMKEGARTALPGEFSFRAVKNHKLSLSQAQAVADLIAAGSDEALTMALEKLSHQENSALSRSVESLKQLMMWGEVSIDFSDQDIEELEIPALKQKLDAVIQSFQRLHDSFARGRILQDGIQVAFVGQPNSGKSSLFNALLGEQRSIVTDIAGTTRDVVSEKLFLRDVSGGFTFRVLDTAGLRNSSDRVESLGIEKTHESMERSDLILLCYPMDEAILRGQDQVLTEIGNCLEGQKAVHSKVLVVWTKRDLLPPSAVLPSVSALSLPEVHTSSMEATGVEDLQSALISWARTKTKRNADEWLLTRKEQQLAVAEALKHLNRAKEAPDTDLFAADLRQALQSMEVLIGQSPSEELLNRIFSEFCIGK